MISRAKFFLIAVCLWSTQMAPALAEDAPRDAIFRKSQQGFEALGYVGPFYPQVAVDRRLNGEAIVRCRLLKNDLLRSCRLVSETPRGVGFGPAAIIMARKGWITTLRRAGEEAAARVDVLVSVRFEMAAGR